MFDFIKSLFDPSKKILKKGEEKLPEIKEYIKKYEDKSQEELTRISENLKNELREISDRIPEEDKSTLKLRKKSESLSEAEVELYERIQEIMPEAYAIMALTTHNKLGIMHYDVQLTAGAVLATGQKLVEMKTGEGKTNTFHLPLYLYGLTGRGAHLVTVNDYLARRDGEYAGFLMNELGLTVGIITPEASYRFIPDEELEEQKGEEVLKERQEIGEEIRVSKLSGTNLLQCPKKEAYECDIVVGTNNEFGFDYLRDNMVMNKEDRVQSELYFCIVDEADSILIDEARTPLIISAPASKSNDLYKKFAQVVPRLKKERDYTIEEKEKAVVLTDEGIERLEKILNVKNIWENYGLAHHLENALKAEVFYEKDKEYIIKEGQVMIVDEFTGRVLAGRRYSQGLHQAIEAKEGVDIQQESRTMATITFQNFFRIYKILTGGSGTIMTEQEEFFKIFNLESTAIPTNEPVIREDLPDKVYKNQKAKFNAVVEEIKEVHETGQPILVGTTSVADSELTSQMLDKLDIEHEVLNAKYHERESQIVAKAGQIGAVTVATNMAGRGTDIPLGEGVTDVGGLYVMGTERHEARRIDNQLRGRSGRQGDPGKSRFFVSLDDQIMRIQGGEIVQKIMNFANIPDNMPIESGMVSGAIERAQKKMEGMYFDSRKRVVEYDDVVNQQREIFYTRRYRYLSLGNEFKEAKEKLEDLNQQEDVKEEKIKEAEERLEKLRFSLFSEFKEIIETLSAEYANMISGEYMVSDEDEDSYTQVVDNILGLGNDEFLLEAYNELKLAKKDIKDTDGLRTALRDKFAELDENYNELKEFIENFLKQVVTRRIDNIEDHDRLIKTIFLKTMDELWTHHLDYMQDLREGIGLRGVAQLDPLVEYKNEGFEVFSDLIRKLNDEALRGLLQVKELTGSIDVNSQASGVFTNANQIEDVLTGDREIIDDFLDRNLNKGNSKGKGNNDSIPKNLPRRLRRKLERANKK